MPPSPRPRPQGYTADGTARPQAGATSGGTTAGPYRPGATAGGATSGGVVQNNPVAPSMGGVGGTPDVGAYPSQGRPVNPFAGLTGQQILDFRMGTNAINLGRQEALSDLGFNRGMQQLQFSQTRESALRNLGLGQTDLRRSITMSLQDLERGTGQQREDLTRGVGRGREDLQRNRDRAAENIDQGFDRAEEDLGVNRQRSMTSLIDSLGARGIRNSGVGNRFQGEAASDFDRQSRRLGEDRSLSTNRLNDDFEFGNRRLDEDLSFGLGRLDSNFNFTRDRLNDNLNFGLERLQSNSDFELGQLFQNWEMADQRFDVLGTQIDTRAQTGLDDWENQRQVWSAEGITANVTAGAGGGGSNPPPAKKAPAKKSPAKKAPARRPVAGPTGSRN